MWIFYKKDCKTADPGFKNSSAKVKRYGKIKKIKTYPFFPDVLADALGRIHGMAHFRTYKRLDLAPMRFADTF